MPSATVGARSLGRPQAWLFLLERKYSAGKWELLGARSLNKPHER